MLFYFFEKISINSGIATLKSGATIPLPFEISAFFLLVAEFFCGLPINLRYFACFANFCFFEVSNGKMPLNILRTTSDIAFNSSVEAHLIKLLNCFDFSLYEASNLIKSMCFKAKHLVIFKFFLDRIPKKRI